MLRPNGLASAQLCAVGHVVWMRSLIEELIRIHSESVPPVNRIDVDRSNFDDCLPIVSPVASRNLAADACSDGKCGCRRNHLVGENGRLASVTCPYAVN
jgi:hypothetical protein